MKSINIIAIIFIISSSNVYSAEYYGVVTRVIDGDSIVVKHDDTLNKIRLRYIDAPESMQIYGKQSKKFLSNLLADKSVLVSTEYSDRYGRQLADVYIHNEKESIYINAKMIKSGNAWVYKKYRTNCIVLDFGTATTFDVVTKSGIYNGGVIAPGVNLSIKSLSSSADQIPLFRVKKQKKVIGKNTIKALRSGFYWGYSGLINNIILCN